MATGAKVRAILRDGAGAHDGVAVRKEIDSRRVAKDPKRHPQNSNLLFTFDDGTELAVNSIETVVELPEGY